MGACSSDDVGGASETGAAGDTSAATGASDPTTDKLAQILSRGILVAYFEPDYPPQSIAGEETRPADTLCAPDQLTAPEVTGFDPETTKLVAEGLGVEVCFISPTWTEATAGNWGDRWDIVYGSGSINSDRMERLWMTQPYYAVPNYYFVSEDSKFQSRATSMG